jgi:hypothetical protein
MVLHQNGIHPVPIHLGKGVFSPFPLRPIDEVRLEGAIAPIPG